MSSKNYGGKRVRPHFNAEKKNVFTGTVQGSDKGFAFILPDDKEKYKKDFFVPARSVNGAYHGDKVLAEPVKGTADEANILRVLERGVKRVIGTLSKDRRSAYVYPDNPKIFPVYILSPMLGGAKNGDKVVCEVTSYPKGRAPGGKIVEVLGESGDLECEELSLIRAFELREEFPDDVSEEAQSVCAEPVILGDRRDFRDKLIFTIDGEDTRDIDDGVSLETDCENFVLGVHIADVSHYVKYRSPLDNEAFARGTSVYFPDRVLPMLPKELSNGACSLNEGEDRYALSCIMTFNAGGARLNYEICRSVIRSSHRTTYTEISAICEKDPHICAKYGDLVDTVAAMEKLCLALEKRRENAGSVNLDVKESHIYVDENDEIIIPDCTRTISQRIIEQFMISANEAVAEFLQDKKAPCLYRIHEKPAPEKAETFIAFLRDLGINARCDCEDLQPKDFQTILHSSEDMPYFSVINKVMLRTMQKARYDQNNVGHFGLASKCYCHFTSPIRRYPDLFVHRVLKDVLSGHTERAVKKYGGMAGDCGKNCSERERIADEAERKVDDLYKLAYMSERLGEEFDAVISGVTGHGIYCELENGVEGLVAFEDLPTDDYELIPEKFLLKGKKHSFKLGRAVKVKAVDCDLGRMKTLFILV